MDEHPRTEESTLDRVPQPEDAPGAGAQRRRHAPRALRLQVRNALIAVAIAALGVAAGVSVGTGGDGAQAAANADPISAYPQKPRVRGGGNPLANVPQPAECSPARDRGSGRATRRSRA